MAGAPFACEQFALATSGSTQDFTIAGETRTPVAAYFHVLGATAADTSTATHIQSWGATDGTNEWFGTIRSSDNQAISTCETYWDTTGVIGIISSGGTQDALLSFNSFITGGVRLDHDDSPPSAYLVNIWFFFEGDYQAGTVTTGSTVNVATNTSTSGFVPRFLLVHEFGPNAFSSTIRADIDVSIGFVADNAGAGTQQATVVYHEEDAIITTENAIITDNAHGSGFIARVGTGGGEAFVEYDFITAGFSATPRNQGVAHYIGYLAGLVEGVDVWAGHLTTPAGTTGSFSFTEPNFEVPFGFIGLTALLNENFTTGAASEGVGLGMFTPTDQLSGCGSSDDNRATAVNMTLTRSFITASSVINVQAPPGTTFYAASWTAATATGFTVNITTGNANARLLPSLLFEPFPDFAAVDEDLGLVEDVDPIGLAVVDETLVLNEEVLGASRARVDETLALVEDPQAITGSAVDEVLGLFEEVEDYEVFAPDPTSPAGEGGTPRIEDGEGGGPRVVTGSG